MSEVNGREVQDERLTALKALETHVLGMRGSIF